MKPDPCRDIFRIHEDFPDRTRSSDVAIGISLVDPNTKTFQVHACNLNKTMSDEWGEQQLGILELIFRMLHVMLITNNHQGQEKYDPLAFPTRDAMIRLASSDTLELHRLLFALARGSNLADHARALGKGISWDKGLLTTCMLTDVLRHLQNK
jgi:hypothetical protein